MHLINKDRAMQSSYRYGACVNIVRGDIPSLSCYTYGKMGGKTVKLYFAEWEGVVGWWWSET